MAVYVDPTELGDIALVLAQRGYVNIPRAAKALGIHPQTLHTYVKKGWVRSFQVGARKCISFDEIKRYKEEGNYDPSKEYQH